MPRVTVIMNCLNGEAHVRAAIESVYAQSFDDWEIVFWDNASSDATAEIAQSFDSKLRYFRSPETVPLGEARNRALAAAQGDWVAFLDHDDLLLPDRLKIQMAAVEGADYSLCYGGMREIDEAGRLVRDVVPLYKTGQIFDKLLAKGETYLQTTMINRAYLTRYDIRAPASYLLFEDVSLFLKAAARGPVCVVPDVVSIWRLLPTSLTESKRERMAQEYRGLLADLRAFDPGLAARYPDAFRLADAKADYYAARVAMDRGETALARTSLRGIIDVSPIYFALYLLTFWPRLWKSVHGRSLKARLTNLLLRRGTA